MYLLLFDTIKVVEGVKNGILLDLQKFKYYPVNKYFLNALRTLRTHSLEEVYAQCNSTDNQFVEGFINFLCENELGFLAHERDPFINDDFVNNESEFFFGYIDNAIIEVEGSMLPNCSAPILELIEIGCRAVEFRFIGRIDFEVLERFFHLFDQSAISAFNLCLPFQSWMKEFDVLTKFCRMNLRIHFLVIHSSPFEKSFVNRTHVINYIQDEISELSCGTIFRGSFSCNTFFYLESIANNSCLHKKLSIDRHGNIKNCPSMPESFGNIRDTTLVEALEKPGFKKYWDINKDKVHVCKDCEFRYICTDCRAYVEDPQDIYSKPLKCGYNPYTGEWSEWSTNPLKQKAIDFYGMRELVEKSNKNISDKE